MKENTIETLMGFGVLLVAMIFAIFAYANISDTSSKGEYTLKANFQSAEGIIPGSNVMVAGIKVGSVSSMKLNRDTFFAMVEMKIRNDIKIPTDSQAAIVSSGFLGDKFISIVPGGDKDDFKDNDQITHAQSSVNMEALIGKFMYSFGNKQ